MARQVKWPPEALNDLRAAYNQGTSVASLALYYKLSRVRIYQLLAKAGVRIHRRAVDLGPQTTAAIQQIEEGSQG